MATKCKETVNGESPRALPPPSMGVRRNNKSPRVKQSNILMDGKKIDAKWSSVGCFLESNILSGVVVKTAARDRHTDTQTYRHTHTHPLIHRQLMQVE